MNAPLLNSRSGSFRHTLSSFTGVNEDSPLFALTLGCNLLEVDDQLLRVVFGVREELGGVQCEDVVGDGFRGFVEAAVSGASTHKRGFAMERITCIGALVLTYKNSFDSPKCP